MVHQYNIERREKARAEISIPIQLLINNPPKDIPSEITAQTLNISEGGLCFRTQNLLTNNSKISINLKSQTSNLKIRAIIAWNNPVDEKRGFYHGTRFIKVEKGDINILREILYQDEEFIEEQVKDILTKIEDKDMRSKVSSFFKNSVKNFIEDLITIQGGLRNESISNETAQNKISEACDRVIKKCYNIENSINNKIIIKLIREKFRMMVGTWAYQSEIVRMAYERPRGYPGDYIMLETIYDNRSISSEMGSCIDRYYLNNPYAIAVRNRKEKIKTILNNFLINNLRKEPIRILNIACGSCRELNELRSKEVSINSRVNLIALDQDEEALEYSRTVLKDLPKNINIRYIKENIINFFKTPERCKNLLGSQDFIYSIGLADYLPDTMLKKLIRFCFEILKDEGKLVIAHKDREKGKLAYLFPNWFCDWIFIPRNVDETVKLVKDSGIENFNIEIEREPSEQIFFIIITKTIRKDEAS